MARFIYKGPFQARTIKDGDKTVFDGNLAPGKNYDLPAEHPEINALIVGGLMVPVPEATAEDKSGETTDKAKTKKKES